ncbi:ArsR/SmtB family transcription factor [Neisseria chenwenguii]|uniref:ArsR/SmtB family transcription factor n=1 Tax=Neisseria chenwenguii TaxID=1853278 RepID=UPI000F4E7CF4|nr:helix-turn-helix transcriptional regulator [Neisseria chenwenguii]ROV54429.1 transcriptional regulator [Neisseria chenwenguii]
MNFIEICKILANENRVQMLQWLKNPERYFLGAEFTADAINSEGGVCVQAITVKSGLAQSVVSNYLNSMKTVGLVSVSCSGKWTYYRYQAQAVERFLADLQQNI